jgi:hypothetical protein
VAFSLCLGRVTDSSNQGCRSKEFSNFGFQPQPSIFQTRRASHGKCVASNFEMNRSYISRLAVSFMTLLFVLPVVAANTPGVFRGVLVEGPQGESGAGFVYLRSRNGNVRKVETTKAVVAYDDAVPKDQQTSSAAEALKPGTDVRITAEQTADGEWHASRIDILGNEAPKPASSDTDDPDDDDGYSLIPYGSNRPVLRKS